jgi:hypothetical protein
MLRVIELFNNLPQCFVVDPDVNFEPGQVAALKIKRGETVVTICDGLNPIGILDDIKTDKLRNVVWNDVLIVRDKIEYSEDGLSLGADHKFPLNGANVIAKSFVSNIPVQLNAAGGEIIIPKGTPLNFCLSPSPHSNGKDFNDAIRIVVSYAYNSFLKSGFDDSTQGSKRLTVWYKNMIADTDMFDTSVQYPKYAPLYARDGLLTTKFLTPECKCIGVVLDPPKNHRPMLRFLLDIDGRIEVGTNSINGFSSTDGKVITLPDQLSK